MWAPNLRRRAIGLGLLCWVLAILALGVTSAFADRTYDSQAAFSGASSAAFDANDNIWVTGWYPTLLKPQPGWDNPGYDGLDGLDAYPSQTLLDTPITPWSIDGQPYDVAVDQSNHDVFVGNANPNEIVIFSKTGFSRYTYTHSWTTIDGHSVGANVAIDNSNTFSRGRVYLSIPSPQNEVEVFDAAQRPVEFPATASYISGNALTGTPSGPFASVQNTAVDSNGDLFVFDTGNNVVDEFASSGTFLRTFPGGVPATDPTNGNVLIRSDYYHIAEYDSSGNLLETINDEGAGVSAVNSQGYLYSTSGNIYTPAPVVPKVTYEPVSSPTTTSGTLNASVNPNGGGDVTECKFEYGEEEGNYSTGTIPCSPPTPFSATEAVSAELSGLTTGTTYHYRVVVEDANGVRYGEDQTYTPQQVLGLSTDAPTAITESGATLNASFVGDGTDTHYYFEWGPTTAYGNETATPPGDDANSPSGPPPTPLSTDLTSLAPYTTYHYRVVATNGSGTVDGQDQMFTTTPGVPTGQGAAVTAVHSDRAVFQAQVNPNGADTNVHFEYVDDATFQQSGWTNATVTSPEIGLGMGKQYQSVSTLVDGLSPDTLYHYRVVGTNNVGSGNASATFHTFAFTPSFVDPCPNAHVRQQTGASLLLDCRAYELASASDTGGYDVESDLVAGQMPFGGYPNATNPSQLLYGVHNGGIPGTGNPTNNGVDPYVATRTDSGWTTKYVGIPANDPYASGPFSSTLTGADQGLDTFAFGGPNICAPCFADGSTGIPVHNPDGTLTQGMVGSLDPGPPVTTAGTVKKPLSADGSHLVFGSEQQFEPGANPDNGNATLYSRDLNSATTEVISTDTSGNTIADGDNLAELDISSSGSRTVFGDLVSTDTAGNHYYHLYMHVAGNPDSIDLTPNTTTGALYDGMSADGAKVYFTTTDKLTSDDIDTSADIYRADVTNSSATLTRVSTGNGGTGNTDSCTPAANTIRKYWNTIGSTPNCDVVAVGGGGGVASADGTIYFLSPELLDGPTKGVDGAPNLYLARPGSAPHFIRTLESSANAPIPPAAHTFLRSFGSFSNGVGVAIDHASGDVYVLDIGGGGFDNPGTVSKFDSSGHPVLGFGNNGTLIIPGMIGLYNLPTQIAVDNDPSSPNYGDLYVPSLLGGAVDKFDSSGHQLAQISISLPTTVAVDPTNGNVYIGVLDSLISVYDTSGAPVTSFSTIGIPTGIAVDSNGNAYVTNGGTYGGRAGTTEKYDSSGNDLGQLDGNPSKGVAVDPSNDHVYVDEGNRVVEFDSTGNPVGVPTGSALLVGSISLAADSGTLAISNPGQTNVAMFGPPAVPPDPSTDNPLVVDSVSSAETRNTADFQVNPSGNDAVFTSTLPLTGYDNAAHREVFRYDAPSDNLDCASCNPTGEQANGEATLASNGLSLTDDGRVFFNSTEGLVDRDLNEREDVYEWEPQGAGPKEATCEIPAGCQDLISTGTSPYASSLLSASSDGSDAYFFTRDTLVSGDGNGSRVKIYDARAAGGFPQVPPPHQCQASDECHGPGSQEPPPPSINTLKGTLSNLTHQSNQRRHKKHHHHHHHRTVHHHRGGHK